MRVSLLLVVQLLLGMLWGTAHADEKTRFVFTPEAVERSGPPSKTLVQALRLYESKDFHAASILLHQVIKGESGDGEAHRQRAEFVLGKALFHLGYHSVALSFFDRVMERGDRHRYHRATLKWLAALSGRLPESSGILKRIGRYTPADLEQPSLAPVREQLRYLMGRRRYNQGRLKEARELFAAVGSSSPFFPRARYMLGVVHVRLGQAQKALNAFRAVLGHKGTRYADSRRLREMARLATARVLFAVGQFRRSVNHYERIPHDSPHWLTAMFESGWNSFHRGEFGRALGRIHTLGAPFFEKHFFPEAHILQAVIYWRHCQWDRSKSAIDAFNRRYPRLKRQIDALLARHRETNQLFHITRLVRQGRGNEVGLGPQPARLARLALDDRILTKQLQYITRLGSELRRFKRTDPAWRSTSIAAEVLQDLALQRSLAQTEAGQLARQRLERVSKEIRKLTQQAIKVEYETIRARKEQFWAEIRGYLLPAGGGSAAEVKVDDEHQFWPFEGPYWRDELDSYHVRVSSRCRGLRPRAAVTHPLTALKVTETPLDVSF